MNVCIVGAGWYGCHAAMFLRKRGMNVYIIDSGGFFAGASSKNQNRLHLGYHYPRSPETVNECVVGYRKFLEQYGFCVQIIPRNLYLIHNDSKVTLTEYGKVYTGQKYVPTSDDFQNVESVGMLVDERYINNSTAKEYFYKNLNSVFCQARAEELDLSQYDWIINCTNNTWKPFSLTATYECFCSLLYKIEFPETTAITIMDGPFFSIFPYDMDNQIYTVTHVVHGVIYRGNTAKNYQPNDIDTLKRTIEKDVCEVFPSFQSLSTYIGYFVSNKTKYDYITDDRSLRWFRDGNYLSFSGGKITGVFEMEKILEEICLCSQTDSLD